MTRLVTGRQGIVGACALALIAAGCAPRKATMASAGVPRRLHFPWDEAKLTVYQRASKRLPGVNGQLRIGLSDITAGQVLVTVEGPNREPVVDLTCLREEQTLSIPLVEEQYVLRLDRLVDLLIGHDFAVFTVMPAGAWRTKNAVPSCLDLPWDQVSMTLAQRTSRKLPGEDGFVNLHIGDITMDQVLTTVYGPNGEVVVDTAPLRQGDAVRLSLARGQYALRLDELVNLPAGEDYAVFSLMQRSAWEATRIDSLLDAIAASEATFLRNDEELTGSEFATHLRRKHQHFGSRDDSAERFIRQTATSSSSTGQPYRLRLPDGTVVEVAAWLREQDANLTATSQPAE